MSKYQVHGFTKLDDKTAANVFEGDEYQAISDTMKSHRVVINPSHADPKKSLQLHVREGERNATDPLRFERVEVYEADQTGEAPVEPKLVWYGDMAGNAEPVVQDEAAPETEEPQKRTRAEKQPTDEETVVEENNHEAGDEQH